MLVEYEDIDYNKANNTTEIIISGCKCHVENMTVLVEIVNREACNFFCFAHSKRNQ